MLDSTGQFTKKDGVANYLVASTGLLVASIVILIALPIFIFVASVVQAYVLSTLWGWYVVPFFAAKPLPMVVAFGLSLIVNYVHPHLIRYKEDTRGTGEKLLDSCLRPAVALLMGWVGTFFL